MIHCSEPESALKFCAIADKATLTTEPSTKARLEARIVAVRIRLGCLAAVCPVAHRATAESQTEWTELMANPDGLSVC